ncbi:MAG: radical SAM protein [bacterium]
MKCAGCGAESAAVSSALGICAACITGGSEAHGATIAEAHRKSREEFGLPCAPPRSAGGLTCEYCARGCRLADGETGFCGVRVRSGGRILHPAGADCAYMLCYYDPLPTNCVASWVCAGCSPAGYPEYSRAGGTERGYKNLAAFYAGCNFNCLFCQNWSCRRLGDGHAAMTPGEVASLADSRTSCICFFGGDPGPHVEHSIRSAEAALERAAVRPFRVCWETNGCMTVAYLEKISRIALESGGCVKVDIKAFSPELHNALCGIGNAQVLRNVELLASVAAERRTPPLFVASTLLVPGYVTPSEVKKIAAFIASLDPDTPYSLLAFSPQFYMDDLPATSRRHMEESVAAAREAGLKNINAGNPFLLSSVRY